MEKDYEIILVDDGSPDETWTALLKVHSLYSNVKIIRLSRNFGQHFAIAAALNHTRGDWVVIMDCDLQDQPEEIHKLYSKAMECYDCVLGSRSARQDPLFRRCASRVFYLVLSYVSGTSIDPSTANFGIFSRRLIDAVGQMTERGRWYPGMIRWIGYPSAIVPIAHASRLSGKSSYSLRKLFHFAVDIVCMFSDKPLWLSIKCGLILAIMSLLIGFVIAARKIFGSSTPPLGWTSLFISIWFVFGILLLNFGLVGIYIARILNEVRSRPLYITSEVCGFERDKKA